MPGNIHDVPQSVLETWPTPNYVDPIRRDWLPAFSLVWLIVSTTLVWGRFFLRARKQAGPFGLDDLFIALAWLFSVGLTTCAWLDTLWYGLGRHTWDVRLDQYTGAALMGYVGQVLMLISTVATKFSVLLFYRRMVVDTISKRWKYAIWAALGFTTVYFIGVLLTLSFVCQPLEAYWMSYDFEWHKPYHCVEATALNPVIGVLSIVSDLYAVALPCVMLQHYELDVPRKQKIGLNVIFALGTLVAGAGIARTYYLIELGLSYDTSWVGFDLFVWSIVECQLAIICACAPSVRAFFRRYLGDRLRRTFHSSSYARQKEGEHSSVVRSRTQGESTMVQERNQKQNSTVNHRPVMNATAPSPKDLELGYKSLARTRSGDTIPKIKTAEDYEAYNMKQLSRHGYKRSNTASDELTHYDLDDPKKRHDVDNAVRVSCPPCHGSY